ALVETIDFEPQARAFQPHVTVGRVARGARMRPLELDAPPARSFAAGPLTLYRSRTDSGGARYEPIRP
nr:hypothetical protein [Solirubrobacterales bacterium]